MSEDIVTITMDTKIICKRCRCYEMCASWLEGCPCLCHLNQLGDQFVRG